jgi:hypothetical protein
MKKLLLLSLTLLFNLQLISQIWNPISTGLSGANSSCGNVRGNCFAIYNNKLIVGGKYLNAGGNNSENIASWDGSNWSPMNTGLSHTLVAAYCPEVMALAVFNNTLYAGGYFNLAGATPLNNLAKWNGVSWIPWTLSMHTPTFVSLGLSDLGIHSLYVFNNALYVGGIFDSIGGIAANNIAKWDGISWSALGNGVTTSQTVNPQYTSVDAIYSFNNELIVGGIFAKAGTTNVNNIAKWNGSSWSALSNGIPASGDIFINYSGVTSLMVFNSELYAGNNTSGVSKWNGTSWSAVGGGIQFAGGFSPSVVSMCVYNGKLIAGGYFQKAGTNDVFNIAAWNGSNWNYVGGTGFGNNNNGLGSVEGVRSLIVYNTDLYACGNILNDYPPLTLTMNNICRFSGTIGIKENLLFNQVSVSPNPSTGQFTFEGLTGNSSIEVTDLTGRIIYTGQLDESKKTINLQDKNSGVYFYKIKNKENKVQQGKLILQ